MPDEERRQSVVLPNMGGDFHGFNIDKWADTARSVVSYNVLDSVEKYALAVNHFEDSLITLIEREEGEETYLKKLENFIQTQDARLSSKERLEQLAHFKLRELTKLVDRFRKKPKSYVIDPILARQEMMARVSARKKIEVVEDGVDESGVQ